MAEATPSVPAGYEAVSESHTVTVPAPAPAPAPAVHLSLWQRIKIDFESIIKMEPKVELVTISILTAITPLVGTVLAFADPAAIPELQNVVGQVTTDLVTLTNLIKSSGNALSVQAVFNAIKANLPQIQTAIGVKSPTATATMSTIVNELDAIAASLPALKATNKIA